MMNAVEWMIWTIAAVFGVLFNLFSFADDYNTGKIKSFIDVTRSQLPTAIAFFLVLSLIAMTLAFPVVAPIGGRRR